MASPTGWTEHSFLDTLNLNILYFLVFQIFTIPFNPEESGYLRNCLVSSNPMSLVINFIPFNLWFSKHNDHSPLPSLLHLHPFRHQYIFNIYSEYCTTGLRSLQLLSLDLRARSWAKRIILTHSPSLLWPGWTVVSTGYTD